MVRSTSSVCTFQIVSWLSPLSELTKASRRPSGDHVPAELMNRSALKCDVVLARSSSAMTSPVSASATNRLKLKILRREMNAT
jgi:hypothetical protein